MRWLLVLLLCAGCDSSRSYFVYECQQGAKDTELDCLLRSPYTGESDCTTVATRAFELCSAFDQQTRRR